MSGEHRVLYVYYITKSEDHSRYGIIVRCRVCLNDFVTNAFRTIRAHSRLSLWDRKWVFGGKCYSLYLERPVSYMSYRPSSQDRHRPEGYRTFVRGEMLSRLKSRHNLGCARPYLILPDAVMGAGAQRCR